MEAGGYKFVWRRINIDPPPNFTEVLVASWNGRAAEDDDLWIIDIYQCCDGIWKDTDGNPLKEVWLDAITFWMPLPPAPSCTTHRC